MKSKSKIDLKETKHIAELSKLEFDDAELARQRDHLQKMLWIFDTLDAADVSGVEPTAHISSAVNVLRDDVVKPSFEREMLLANAPASDGAAFIVPRVVE